MDHIRSLHRTIDTGPTAGFTPKHSKDLADEAEAIPNAHGKLWKITAPNGAISHLWGTIHSTHRQLLELPDKLEALIDQARLVATEFSPIYTSRTDLANANSQDWMFRRALRPLLEYDTVFEGDIGIWLKARLQSMGWGGLECDLTDAGLAYLLMFDACDDFSSFSIPIQDNRIYMLGREVGAQTIGLEHAKDFQRYVSDPENSNTALAIVKSYAAYLNPELYEPATTLANTAGLYLQGRIGEMMVWDRHMLSDFFGRKEAVDMLEQLNGYLLSERNQIFLKTIRPELVEGGVLMAVGAFHLPGAQGLMAELRKLGFSLTREHLPSEAKP